MSRFEKYDVLNLAKKEDSRNAAVRLQEASPRAPSDQGDGPRKGTKVFKTEKPMNSASMLCASHSLLGKSRHADNAVLANYLTELSC